MTDVKTPRSGEVVDRVAKGEGLVAYGENLYPIQIQLAA